MDQQKHWDKIGISYDKEIFDVFQSDRERKLPPLFGKYGNKSHSAIDFGCGTGKALHYIAPRFKEVLGVDISPQLLEIARSRKYPNVSFRQLDLTTSLDIQPAHFAFCCNVIMLPQPDKNMAMLKNIRKAIRPGGAAVIVLPSLDSFFYSALRLMEWYKREGVDAADVMDSEFDGFTGSKRDLIRGLVKIDGVTTKHYSLPELELMLPQAGFAIKSIQRLEYNWDTEFSKPPKWMKEPYPWDWLVELGVSR